MRLIGLEVLRSSLLTVGLSFSFFQSIETSPNHCDMSKTLESGLTVTSASSLSTLGCTLSVPTELCPPGFSNYALASSFSADISLPGSGCSEWGQRPGIPESQYCLQRMSQRRSLPEHLCLNFSFLKRNRSSA